MLLDNRSQVRCNGFRIEYDALPREYSDQGATYSFETKQFQQFLYDRYIGDNEERAHIYEQEELNSEIARKIYQLRTKAGLIPRELAKRVGTTASATSNRITAACLKTSCCSK